MKFASKSRMGFLLVLFPEEDHSQTQNQTQSPVQESRKSFNLLLKRTNSANLLHKAQSTISICLLLVFTTLLLFTLSALPPSTAASGGDRRNYGVPRRHLAAVPTGSVLELRKLPHALQGMGTLYRRGSRGMSELVVAHGDSLSLSEFRVFVRVILRSGVTARSDLLFVFGERNAGFDDVVVEENDSFLKLVTRYGGEASRNRSAAGFVEAHFGKLSKKEKESGEPIWGKRIKGSNSSFVDTESTRASYGSVVGFDVEELDPENSLSGFLDHVPMSLRRWACYPMLLGRIRRNFKHIMLVDMKEMLVLGDQLGRVRNHSPESVLVTSTSQSAKHGKRNSDKTQSTRQKLINPGIIAGGSRGVRRLSNAMLTDIVRAAMQQHKKKNSVTESGLFNQLVTNEFVLKNVKVIVSSESVPELSSLVGSKSGPGLSNHSVIRRGNGNLDAYLLKHICSSFPLYSEVYSDC